ncbi:MAG: hypothetical protein K0R39_1130 [Symbiobacteriaceae bacterium]|nr:hypothetical protein [Symbiobacteriaceae bacterium]
MRQYQIRVKGHLGAPVAVLFAGMRVENGPDGDATLTGPVADQAQLRAVLLRVFDLGLELVGVAVLGG